MPFPRETEENNPLLIEVNSPSTILDKGALSNCNETDSARVEIISDPYIENQLSGDLVAREICTDVDIESACDIYPPINIETPPTEDPTEGSTVGQTEGSTESPTEEPTESPTEILIESQTESPSEDPTEPVEPRTEPPTISALG